MTAPLSNKKLAQCKLSFYKNSFITFESPTFLLQLFTKTLIFFADFLAESLKGAIKTI